MYYKGNRKLLPRIAKLHKNGLQVDYNLPHFYFTTPIPHFYRIVIEKVSFLTSYLPHLFIFLVRQLRHDARFIEIIYKRDIIVTDYGFSVS